MELKLSNITKQFGNFTAVDHLSLTMEKGIYGLLGINGAGKTTLMKMVCTLIEPTCGNITYNGRSIKKLGSNYRKLIGYLPQQFGYYPEFTVDEYLNYIAKLKGLESRIGGKRAKELIEKVGLRKVAGKKMRHLSGGMKRRAGIAQALINNPQILILDEPTAGLDPNERIRFRNLISELSEDRLVLLSTHIVSDVEYIANTICLMKDGTIYHQGTVTELVNSMEKHVWKCSIPKETAHKFMKNLTISNVKSEAQNIELRIISDTSPYPGANVVEANLEDVFLYYFGEKAGKEDVVI